MLNGNSGNAAGMAASKQQRDGRDARCRPPICICCPHYEKPQSVAVVQVPEGSLVLRKERSESLGLVAARQEQLGHPYLWFVKVPRDIWPHFWESPRGHDIYHVRGT